MLERILYVSRPDPGTCFEDVCRIVRKAHVRNAGLGVTGALISLDGFFVQMLEGPPDGVGAVFRCILRDRRHLALDLRIRERALCRLFPGHAMALRTGAGLEPGLLADFDYCPGFPVETFPAARLTDLVVSACHCHARARRRAAPGG
jgi:hypothetical protein